MRWYCGGILAFAFVVFAAGCPSKTAQEDDDTLAADDDTTPVGDDDTAPIGDDDDVADDDDDATDDDDDQADDDDDTWAPWGGDPVPGDFSLEDVNPTSATCGQTFTLSEHAGHLVFVYFAYGTCHACAENAALLQGAVDDHPDWGERVQIWFLECPWCTVAYDDLVDEYHQPELQDTDDAAVWTTWVAEKGHAYLIHFDGTIYEFDEYFYGETGITTLVETLETLLDPLP
jgi:hypothetical protein